MLASPHGKILGGERQASRWLYPGEHETQWKAWLSTTLTVSHTHSPLADIPQATYALALHKFRTENHAHHARDLEPETHSADWNADGRYPELQVHDRACRGRRR